MIKLNELMVIERLLLEIDAKFKFDLDFNDALKLYWYLKEIGRITNYSFLIQDEFHKKYNDIEKLKEYHEKVINSMIDYDADKVIEFIEYTKDKLNNEDFSELVLNNKFW